MEGNNLGYKQYIYNRRAYMEHWNTRYRSESKVKKQLENENRYSILTKFILNELSKRGWNHKISKNDLSCIIKDLLKNSKYLSERFKRRRTRNL